MRMRLLLGSASVMKSEIRRPKEGRNPKSEEILVCRKRMQGTQREKESAISLRSLHCNSPNCSQAASKFVAQIFNLLYRRFSIGRGSPRAVPVCFSEVRGLQIRDTAECNSALLRCGAPALRSL